ncbi:MAG TPA: hypothetical protein V6C91_13450 [Coleofasciculaceae cyanobacterium]
MLNILGVDWRLIDLIARELPAQHQEIDKLLTSIATGSNLETLH